MAQPFPLSLFPSFNGELPLHIEVIFQQREADQMESGTDHFDVVVVGAGIIGSCAAYAAAKRGSSVLLLEQFDFLHHRGSSHGESRTIRATYPEPYYASMVLASSRLWEAAQADAGYRVLTPTKHFEIGPADSRTLQAIVSSCSPLPIGLRVLDASEVADMFSGAFHLPEGWTALISDAGGIIKPTKAVAMFQTLAMKHGAVLRDHMEVTEIKRAEDGEGVRVTTAAGDEFRGRKCVVAAGAWTRKLVMSTCKLVLPIQPLQVTIYYWRIKEGHEAALSLENGFPTFGSCGEPYIYGTPSMEFPGLIKVAVYGGDPCDPDKRDWTCKNAAADDLASWFETVMPGVIETAPAMTQSCMFSMTPDEDYVIDFLGNGFGEDVVVAGGFSGHGFKMGPEVGRILAELAIDGEAAGVELGHFRLGRYRDNPDGNAKDVLLVTCGDAEGNPGTE